ncbi:MAG: hypothetical protein A3B74_00230 [Candidatus Kerfeldbacteria bacterium RIFCSPHIGHO2_02_FULL_42_14]|uniref:Ribulose-phosphate 3-epimerase n=1 Tax=Candidatus Kerfeldbacteria bacterium RIFCSPHIGHO2_02_FULL_42_14 TaxID=1798540 RepID=A0A1G2AQT6_9BACT|nr:MAG: hypothetical protein A3B74_00230 [Candidatus Kerfeldbacteria bacterium RIFCSPHIGHO2_02_FULL_42_14]OGY81295.1 MAG: hypothetical protein A3E60_02500 [Candidatus Kerfeldbacteria bacterium RIFCSPHIGHO2_12_FULL_42_13]OGY83570.1 MAG: hypothetical protein A3I91_02935 [Candidatus Kerfeldbacteria bacterium RIFCSPLOWO2_02_FULL_42_19]OGY86714.1 MAG: hypothetical protein A3G01_00685 [Candidatus Kerfeldbacteria bacterium RIFCSPLOWO2_12_FULL_43_9]
MTKIIPGILEKDFSEIQKKVQLVKPHVDRVHIDILDGTFVPYESFCNPAELRTLPITLELHLMIQRPEFVIRKWGALPNVDRLIVHLETVSNAQEILHLIHKTGKQAGFAVNPESRIPTLQNPLRETDMMLIMGVDPGQSGQPMLPDSVEKLKEACKLFPEKVVSFDGGVRIENVRVIREAGASEIVVNSALFHAPDIAEALQYLCGQ